MRPARYHPAARRELRDAIEHDEGELLGRGLRLEEQVARVLLRVRRFPESAPIWPGLDSAYEVRRAKVRRHPYVVVYMAYPEQLVILAVAHLAPALWRWFDTREQLGGNVDPLIGTELQRMLQNLGG